MINEQRYNKNRTVHCSRVNQTIKTRFFLSFSGFSRTEFRGKLAIAITANFTNRNTTAEAKVEEISGVAFIFNQKFFLDLKEETGKWKSIKHTIITRKRATGLMLNLLILSNPNPKSSYLTLTQSHPI